MGVFMGTRGPIPKRSEARRRRNKPVNKVKSAKGAEEFKIPGEDRSWHPIAKKLWRYTRRSGQVRFYEPSDWAVLYSLCDDISYYKKANKRSGQMLASIMSALSSLLLTEGDRRRVQIELQRGGSEGDAESSAVADMEAWRRKLSG